MSSNPSFTFSLLSPGTSSTDVNLTAADKIEVEDMPEWLKKIIKDKGADSGYKVMEKQIYASDVSKQQNRLMISKQIVKNKIKPLMTKEEIAAANLTSSERLCGGEGQIGGRKRGREHKGLEVKVYNRSGWGCPLYLIKWDASEASMLKGANYKHFCLQSNFTVNNLIEMWAFRCGDGKLNFVIRNYLELSL